MTTVTKLKTNSPARPAKSGKLTAAQGEKLNRDFLKSAAPLNKAQVEEVERIIAAFEITRRVGLFVLTRSGQELRDSCEDQLDAKALAESHAAILGYRENLTKLCDLMNVASTRLMVALCGNPRAAKALKTALNSRRHDELVDLRQFAAGGAV